MNQVFKALNDPTRRRILELLRHQSRTAGEIADACGVPKPTLSHHLDLLMRADLVDQEKQGTFRRYQLNTSVVEDVMLWLGSLLADRDEPFKRPAASEIPIPGSLPLT